MVAISPWNFPLAIFVGQVGAALAAGNPVLAKPAEQTPLIAFEAVRLLHRAGVPRAALQLLPGAGETIGAALVADPRIAGVLFTGSTEVAHVIHRGFVERADDPVLIAETGGQNAMIVDSSALPEQVVNDAIVSAFDSAGQRCSALRVLCIQDDIADHVIAMLKGAMRELAVGDPRRLATDVGPVIDADARTALTAHITRMRERWLARLLSCRCPPSAGTGRSSRRRWSSFPASPRSRSSRARSSGPCSTSCAGAVTSSSRLIDAINALGYGLTHGIHTRIDETAAAILARIRAGNVYVNRNMIGAVVGVQPFGGHGLSGTGPKAGGPLYVRRLVRGAAAPMPAARIVLPGPTGEANTLELSPRGVVACIADDVNTLIAQARAARAAGNTPLWLRTPASLAARDRVGDARRSVRQRARSGRRRRRVARCISGARAARARPARGGAGSDRAGHRARSGRQLRPCASRRRADGDGEHGGGGRQCRAAVAVRGRLSGAATASLAVPRRPAPCATSTPRRFARACRGRACWRRSTEFLRDDVAAPLRTNHAIAVPGEAAATLLLMPAWRVGHRIGVKLVTVFPGNRGARRACRQRGLRPVRRAQRHCRSHFSMARSSPRAARQARRRSRRGTSRAPMRGVSRWSARAGVAHALAEAYCAMRG